MLSDVGRRASRPDDFLQRHLVLGIVTLIPMGILSIKGHANIDAGIVLSVLVAPITLRTTLHSQIPRRLLALLLVATACGPALTVLATTTARGVDRAIEIQTLFLALSLCAAIPSVFWSAVKSGWATTLNAFALGAIVQGALDHTTWSGDPWKYVFAWPVTALVLPKRGWGTRSRLYGIALAFALMLVSIAFDYRSFAGCLVGAVAIGVMASRHSSVRVRSVANVGMVCLVGIGLYFGGSYAATHGFLGHSIQLTSQEQTASGQTLLIGARPEFGAGVALFASRPIGFGPGVIPSEDDIAIAKDGLSDLGGATTGTFVDQFLLGDHIELHSIVWDLWVDFGLIGLAAGLYLAWLCVRLLLGAVADQRAAPIVLLALGLSALWDVFFSPLGNLMMDLVALLALLGFLSRPQQMKAQRGEAPAELRHL